MSHAEPTYLRCRGAGVVPEPSARGLARAMSFRAAGKRNEGVGPAGGLLREIHRTPPRVVLKAILTDTLSPEQARELVEKHLPIESR